MSATMYDPSKNNLLKYLSPLSVFFQGLLGCVILQESLSRLLPYFRWTKSQDEMNESGLIFRDGVPYWHIGMDRNFVCLWRRHNCRSQVIDLSLSALIS
jgi:hypothetical protein